MTSDDIANLLAIDQDDPRAASDLGPRLGSKRLELLLRHTSGELEMGVNRPSTRLLSLAKLTTLLTTEARLFHVTASFRKHGGSPAR
jgi:hypothetical protein